MWVVFKALSLKQQLNITFLPHLVPFAAYQLRVCQPPPRVANAEILAEDDEFEIGKTDEHLMIICLRIDLSRVELSLKRRSQGAHLRNAAFLI